MTLADELTQLSPADALVRALQIIDSQTQELSDKSIELALKTAALDNAESKIKALTYELAYKSRALFGVKSEAITVEQFDFFKDSIAADLAAIEAELEIEQAKLAAFTGSEVKKPRTRAGRQALPAHLPRIVHRHEPESCTCPTCNSQLVQISEDVSEQLDVEPAKFVVHQHIRPQYACKQCQTMTAAPVPAAIIDGGMATTGLLAWVAIGKYADHLPLYRIEQMAAREGVILAKSTLCEWIGKIGVALQPLIDRLAELMLERQILHADETPIRQLDPGSGKTKRAYLWAYRTADFTDEPPIVLFDYQNSRAGQCARDFLKDWRGTLMVDDYGAYKALFRQGVTELGCWAHARRNFYKLYLEGKSVIAAEALRRIGQLYEIERHAKSMTNTERLALRQSQALPVLASMREWLHEVRLKVLKSTHLAKAIDYVLNRWDAFARYVEAGDYPIDNNPVENNIRPIAIGKKNWLFAGSERAGKRAAAIQSLLATAKLNGLDPAKWLSDTLAKLPTWPNSRLVELLPLKQSSTL
ncbi:IS66 family transposase [Hydromonas duriensis]|uniref:Transposase n=1 Tax=Hydromonas duriensis TaxID=1527608 RepID=A0A4R6Y1F5_9BURK|nr:transposase [Hydromonas duriensis]